MDKLRQDEIKNQIIKTIHQNIKDDEFNKGVLTRLSIELQKKWQGKTPNKRIEKDALKALEQYHIIRLNYSKYLSWFELRLVIKNNNNDDLDLRFILCYDNEQDLDFTLGGKFSQRNAWAYEGAIERIEKNKKFLESGSIDRLAGAYLYLEKAKDWLSDDQFDSYELPSRYAIDRALKHKE